MNSLGKYADSLKIEMNQKKNPKVLAFDKPTNTKECISQFWSIGNLHIDEETSYKYLGVTFKTMDRLLNI